MSAILSSVWALTDAHTDHSQTVYASEVMPVNLRGYLTSYVNLCWVIGQFIASGVLVGVQSRTDMWGWRIPYAVQWIWAYPNHPRLHLLS